MKKHVLPIFALAVAGVLASCGGPQDSGYQEPSIDRTNPAAMLLSLRQAHNYTVHVRLRDLVESSTLAEYNVYYTDKSYHFAYSQGDYGLILSSDGAYPFSVINRVVKPGELLVDQAGMKYHTIWNTDLFYSFANFDEKSLVGKEDTELNLTSKSGRIALLDMASLDSSYYSDFSSVKATILDSGDLHITGYIVNDVGSYQIAWTVTDIGSTVDTVVENYVNNGGSYHVPTEALSKAKKLFAGDNYTHYYYTLDDQPGGWEYFTKDYYFTTFTSEFMAENVGFIPSGYIGVDHKNDPSTGKQNLYGIYMVNFGADQLGNINNISVYETIAFNTSTSDITEAIHYPKEMLFWDRMEDFSPRDEIVHAGMEEAYQIGDTQLAIDAAENFGVLSVFTNAGLAPTAIILETKDLDGDAKIWFTIVANDGTYLDFEFGNFGSTSVAPAEDWLETLVDR